MAWELELWDCTWEPRRVGRGVEMSVPPSNEWKGTTCDWRGYEIVPELSCLWIERAWNPLREEGGWEEIVEGRVESVETIVLSEQGWHLFCTTLAPGQDLMWLLGDAEARARQAGERFANKGWDMVSGRVVMGGWKEFKPPGARIKSWVPEFVANWFGGFDHVTEVADTMERIHVNCTWLAGEFYRTSLKYGPFHDDRAREVLIILDIERNDQQEVTPETREAIIRREVAATPCYVDDVFKLFEDRESAKLEGTREDGKDASIGESSGKAGGSKRGPQENREGGNDMRTSPRNSAGATPKKTKVSDASRKLAEIEKQTAEFKARLIEQMMAEDEEDPQGAGSREGRRTGQDEARYEGKDNSHKRTPSKKGKDKNDPPTEETENTMTPPAIDSGTSRLPTTPKVTRACDGLWNLRERVLGWFDPEGTPKTREKQRKSKAGEGTSAAREAGGSEDGLKRVVATLTRTLNKSQGYLADSKKKLTFDGANITEFLIDYENLAALLNWTEEEKMEHLGQHVSLSLGRDIMAIIVSSGSWKETRNEMMRKYLKAEKMATKAELAAVRRKNYATYNDFLRAFMLVALRIPGVTDRIMSKYFLRQFSEFDKDKILSAYLQTNKFEYTRDVDFSTVTDLAEKTVVTETLTLLKEGKVKKGIESLHERVHEVDSKMDRMENALLVMQAQVSRPALPPQEAVVPAAVANRGFGRRDPANEQSKYCTMIGHFVRACPRLNHDIELQRCSRSLKGEILGPTGERVNWNSPGGMRRAVILLNNLEIVVVEAEPIAEIVWDQPRGRGPQANFILQGNGQDRRMTVMEEMDHDVILGRSWCANVEMIGMHLHDGTYMVDIEDPVTGHGELLRLLGTGGDPPKGKLATWSPTFEESARKGAFARMEGMRERVEIVIEEAFSKKEWIKMGLPVKKRRPEDESLGVMVAEKEQEVELGASLPKPKEGRNETPELVLEVPDLLQLVKAIRYHKVGVDPAALAKFEDEVGRGDRKLGGTGARSGTACGTQRERGELETAARRKDVRSTKGGRGTGGAGVSGTTWDRKTRRYRQDKESGTTRDQGTAWCRQGKVPGTACEASFSHLKHALTHHEFLKLPDLDKPFIVTTDASQYGIGAALAQQEGPKLRPIEYMSKKMPSQKLAKSTYEKELYAIYKALTHWRHYLLGRWIEHMAIGFRHAIWKMDTFNHLDTFTIGAYQFLVGISDTEVVKRRAIAMKWNMDHFSRECKSIEPFDLMFPPMSYLDPRKCGNSSVVLWQNGLEQAPTCELRCLRKVWSAGGPYFTCKCKLGDAKECDGGPRWFDHRLWFPSRALRCPIRNMSSIKTCTSILIHYLRSSWKGAVKTATIFIFIREQMMNVVSNLKEDNSGNTEAVINGEKIWEHPMPPVVGKMCPTKVMADSLAAIIGSHILSTKHSLQDGVVPLYLEPEDEDRYMREYDDEDGLNDKIFPGCDGIGTTPTPEGSMGGYSVGSAAGRRANDGSGRTGGIRADRAGTTATAD
ncbi:hypothetical protein CBR_g54863 [Chara braunii]|uniref:Reverse transcriptase/retrotransposon-derived protein RNase H-like domain-containing protein n=1 Tax=Chara braunii TaxID=69332 RepID=A0A388JPP4_CHABU|nr:hypothetical protein CBR_g54863 [Chara braunii]|eukprot:GBG59760.1 hypothetical protein CBR_g54863 [Chara braunii]